MTAKQAYEACLIELNKQEAPSLLLEDFNYLFNKAINQYINRKYNIYDVNQQSTDDLRVLKATAILTPTKSYSGDDTFMQELNGATYEVDLPDDYLHTLNCICVYKVQGGNYKCYDDGKYVRFGAKRLTADMWGQIINNFYMKPSYKRPYYYIHNVNTSESRPTNPITYDTNGNMIGGTDYNEMYTIPGETPEVEGTTYEVIYGVLPNFDNLKQLTYPTATGTNTSELVIETKTPDNSSRLVFVKIPNSENKGKVNMFTFSEALATPLNVVPLSSYSGGLNFETPGYTTYIGTVTNNLILGSEGLGVRIIIN